MGCGCSFYMYSKLSLIGSDLLGQDRVRLLACTWCLQHYRLLNKHINL